MGFNTWEQSIPIKKKIKKIMTQGDKKVRAEFHQLPNTIKGPA